MKYLSIILWLLLGFFYWWIWDSNLSKCCADSNLTDAQTTTSIMNIDTSNNAKSEEAKSLAEIERKKSEDEASKKAMIDAETTKEVTTAKSSNEFGARKLTFYFPYNSDKANYSADAEKDIAEIVQLAKTSGKKITITGHTDSLGDPETNMELGKARANQVMQKFISNGLPASMITSKSLGQSMPVASNETKEGRQQNRRVELIIE